MEVEDEGRITTDGYFTMCPDWLLEHTDVSDRALRLWLTLLSYARSKTAKVAYPSRGLLADRCRCSTDSVDRALKELVAVGALQISHQYRDRLDAEGQKKRRYSASHYHVLQVQAGSSPQGRGHLAAETRPPSRTGAAKGVRATEPEQSSNKELSARATSAASAPVKSKTQGDSSPSSAAAVVVPAAHVTSKSANNRTKPPLIYIPDDWKPNQEHINSARDLDLIGEDFDTMVEQFRYQLTGSRRRNWGSTFGKYIKSYYESRHEVEFPSNPEEANDWDDWEPPAYTPPANSPWPTP